MMPAMSINYLAILACAIVAMPAGFLWFGPLFGKAWARHMGFGGMQQGDAGSMGKAMAIFFVSNLLIALADCDKAQYLPFSRGKGLHRGISGWSSTWQRFQEILYRLNALRRIT